MAANQCESEISLTLTKAQALVLLDFLSRFNKMESKEIFEDQSEEKVLWEVETQLEKILNEPFLANYKSLLWDARKKVRDGE